MLTRCSPEALRARRQPVNAATLTAAAKILERVEQEGDLALRELAEKFDDLAPGAPLVLERDALQAALDALPDEQRALLERTAERIRRFAEAQRASLSALRQDLPGGEAGQDVAPVEAAGCYAPGGRYPLPSSVLMTAVTARAAGVSRVVVATPRPKPIMLAAAAVAGADALIPVGGAQAIGALAVGTDSIAPVDVIVGPGNAWVTAAKQLVAGRVGIDMLAGPSELVVLADETADAATVAADLLAQAEHDPEAVPVLVSTSSALLDAVDAALAAQLAELPTADTARASVEANGRAVLCNDLGAAIALCDALAPEHLQVMTADARAVAPRLKHYGALFVGSGSAEVAGDYGAGPNHVLPTGGTARFSGGLSVFDFLRVRTWLRFDETAEAAELYRDAAALADLEGLPGHAAAARRRLG